MAERSRTFNKSANYYDLIYAALEKDYRKETNQLRKLIQRFKQSEGKDLLDVACGTGHHIQHMRKYYSCEGLDLQPNLLTIARKRNPCVKFYHGNMLTFNLRKQFDVITCLFSAIGYMKTLRELNQAIRNMTRHLRPGGVIIVEPWLTPTMLRPGHVGSVFVNQPKLKIARMNILVVKGRLSILKFHYLIGTPNGVEYMTESDEFGLFTRVEYMSAFRKAGLKVTYDRKGLIGRGLYIGVRPTASALQ
jgi:ubiquinone/menaquinone biosynthesis C-methylase UbiE